MKILDKSFSVQVHEYDFYYLSDKRLNALQKSHVSSNFVNIVDAILLFIVFYIFVVSVNSEKYGC